MAQPKHITTLIQKYFDDASIMPSTIGTSAVSRSHPANDRNVHPRRARADHKPPDFRSGDRVPAIYR